MVANASELKCDTRGYGGVSTQRRRPKHFLCLMNPAALAGMVDRLIDKNIEKRAVPELVRCWHLASALQPAYRLRAMERAEVALEALDAYSALFEAMEESLASTQGGGGGSGGGGDVGGGSSGGGVTAAAADRVDAASPAVQTAGRPVVDGDGGTDVPAVAMPAPPRALPVSPYCTEGDINVQHGIGFFDASMGTADKAKCRLHDIGGVRDGQHGTVKAATDDSGIKREIQCHNSLLMFLDEPADKNQVKSSFLQSSRWRSSSPLAVCATGLQNSYDDADEHMVQVDARERVHPSARAHHACA